MFIRLSHSRFTSFTRAICLWVAVSFSTSLIIPPEKTYAQVLAGLSLPVPGTMVPPSAVFAPALLRGLKVDSHNPFHLDFVIDLADSDLTPQALQEESLKLIKYFLASITIPDNDLWVNLSPHEQGRIIPFGFGQTEMGRDLLAQDYLLKQLTASLIYPENELGKEFWKKVYAKAQEKYGTIDIPVNTFNKVWIMPDSALVYENGTSAFIVKSRLRVMLEEDYLAYSEQRKADRKQNDLTANRSPLAAEIIRELILPEIEREVNEGKNFAQLRQIYHALILAEWFKQRLQQSILYQVYADQNKITGIATEDKTIPQKIYQQYLEAFRKGVFNFIKEETDPSTQQIIPKKYFSGGFSKQGFTLGHGLRTTADPTLLSGALPDRSIHLEVDLAAQLPGEAAPRVLTQQGTTRSSEDASMTISEDAEALLDYVASEGNLRSLIFTENIDALDSQLRERAAKNRKRYLRLTLREKSDLSRLKSRVSVKDGMIHRERGPLQEIIEEGGVLLIDYANSDPDSKEIEAFNSLFDPDPYYGSFSGSPGLTVVGVMRDMQAERHPGSYYSRFRSGVRSLELPFEDPLEQIQELHEKDAILEKDALLVNLYGMTSPRKLRDALIGKFELDESGKILARPGALIQAIQENRQLVIRGGDWNDFNLPHLIRQILFQGYVEFNGEKFELPENLVIFRQDGNYEVGVLEKYIVLSEESTSEGETWVINSETQEVLFGRKHIDPETGKLVQFPGVLGEDFKAEKISAFEFDADLIEELQQQSPLRLFITDKLEDWVWHRIMHAARKVEVQVAPGVYVPPVYQLWRSDKLKKTVREPKLKSWQEVKDEKVIFIQGEDSEAIQAFLRKEVGPAEVAHVDSETTISKLTDDFVGESAPEGPGNWKYQWFEKDILQDLRAGRTVILEGLHNNAALLKHLETALQDDPYLMVNGERLRLQDLPGRLIILMKPSRLISVYTVHATELKISDQQLGEILAKEFSGFKAKDFAAILKLRDLFREHIPLPIPTDLYPRDVNFNLSRLRLLFQHHQQYGSWLKAFENVIIPAYGQDPHLTAYLRVMVRLAFGIDYPDQSANTIHGRKLNRVLNMIKPGIQTEEEDPNKGKELSVHGAEELQKALEMLAPGAKSISDPEKNWSVFFWIFADALSLDLLRNIGLSHDFTAPNRKVYELIRKALVKKYHGEREEFYRYRFNITADVSDAPDIDDRLNLPDVTWQEQKERVIQGLKVTAGVMLKGSPGTGKSFITDQVARELGYSESEIVGPINVGADTHHSDVVVRTVIEDGQTKAMDEAVARWARLKQGGLLIVDEANLPKKSDFWNSLKGVFAPEPYVWINGEKILLSKRHKIIFTGNQETVEGRHFMDLIEEHMITVVFKPFSRQDMRGFVNDYISSEKVNRPELVELVTDLHFFFQKMNPALDFSPRGIQELSDRVNIFWGAVWMTEDIIEIAWNAYSGNFSEQEQMALQYLLIAKYGISIPERRNQRIARVRKQRGEAYQRRSQMTLVDSTAELIADIQDLLRMREARIGERSQIQGKRGMIIEGFPGRGKDVTIVRELYENGFRQASIGDQKAFAGNLQLAGPDTPPTKQFYRLTASLDTDLIISVLRKARKEGSIVIISEMNFLPSGFLEGRLNDVLTGNAHPGFALFGTMNSVDFSGRERLSSALKNRVLYKQLREYTKSELMLIGEFSVLNPFLAFQNFPPEILEYIVNVHLWIRDHIENKEHHPTTREFLRAVTKVAEFTMHKGKFKEKEDAFVEKILTDLIYGPLYLSKFLKINKVPNREELKGYQLDLNKQKRFLLDVAEHIATFLAPSSMGHVEVFEDPSDSTQEGGGYWMENLTALALRSRGFANGDWLYTLYHESSHGRKTRKLGFNAQREDTLWPVYTDLEDLRHEAAFQADFPHSHQGHPSESMKEYARMAAEADVERFDRWMNDPNPKERLTLRQMFQYACLAYGHQELTPDHQRSIRKQQLEAFAAVIDDILPINPIKLALNHLDSTREIGLMIPQSIDGQYDEEEILFQQYRALKKLETMREDFSKIPDEEQPTPDLSEEEQDAELTRSAEAIAQLGGPEVKQQERSDVSSQMLSEEELVRRKQVLLARAKAQQDAAEKKIITAVRQIEADLVNPQQLLNERLEEIIALIENPSYPDNIVGPLKLAGDSLVAQRARELGAQAREILEKRQAILRKFKEMTLPELRKELKAIESDLKNLALSYGRFLEIRTQLRDRGSPISLIPKIEEFDNARVNKLVERLRKVLEETAPLFQHSPSQDILDQAFKELLGSPDTLPLRYGDVLPVNMGDSSSSGGEGGGGFGPGGAPMIGRRHHGVHGEAKHVKRNPVRIGPPRPEKKKNVVLSGRERETRESALQGISRTSQSELMRALDAFFHTRSTPDRVYGLEGDLDLERYIEDANTGFVKTGGVPERSQKEIILSGIHKTTLWNPILEEVFLFLFESGFRVTVYTSPESYVEGIASLSDLKKIIKETKPVREEDIRRDLNRRKQKTDYELTSWSDIQGKVEAVYAYGAFRSVVLGEKEKDESKQAELGRKQQVSERQAEPASVLTFEEQVEKARKIVREFGGKDRDIIIDRQHQTMTLYLERKNLSDVNILSDLTALRELVLWKNPVRDISGLRNLTNLKEVYFDGTDIDNINVLGYLVNLQKVDLGDTRIRDIAVLEKLIHLHTVILYNTDISNDEIFQLFSRHPNRVNLTISNKDGHKITWENVPEKYKQGVAQAEGPSTLSTPTLGFEEQVELAQQVIDNAGSRAAMDVDRNREFILLDLEGASWIDWKSLMRLTRLRRLDLLGVPVTDLTRVEGFSELYYLGLRGTRIEDEQIYELFVHHPNRLELQVSNKTGRRILWADVPEEYKKRVAEAEGGQSESEPLSFEEQMEIVHGLIDKQAVDIISEQQSFGLYLPSFPWEHIDALKRLSSFHFLSLNQISFEKDLNGFLELHNLDALGLANTGIADEQIYELFVLHKNRNNLEVWNDQGNSILWADVPEEYKKRVAEAESGQESLGELSFEKQIEHARGILRMLELETKGEQRLQIGDLPEPWYSLDLRNASLWGRDLAQFYLLPHLSSLNLYKTAMVDEQIYELFVRHPNRERLVIYNDKNQPIRWGNVPLRYKPIDETSLDFEGQVKKASQILDKLKVADREGRIQIEHIGRQIAFSLKDTLFHDVDQLRGINGIVSLDLSFTNVRNIDGLRHLVKLERLNLEKTKVNHRQIEDLFLAHPNREKLIVKSANGVIITWADVPEEYKKQVVEAESGQETSVDDRLTIAQQMMLARDVLLAHGIKEKDVSFRLERKENKLVLDLSGLVLKDLTFIGKLADLTRLNFHKAKIQGPLNEESDVDTTLIQQLFEQHSNAKNLVIIDSKGKIKTYEDFLRDSQPSSTGLSLEEQIMRAKDILRRLGVESQELDRRVEVSKKESDDVDGAGISLILWKTNFNNLNEIMALTDLVLLSLAHTPVKDISGLKSLPHLQIIYLKGTAITDEQIYRLFASHPNRLHDNFRIWNADGREILWKDVPEEYRLEAFNEQVERAKEILRKAGIAITRESLQIDTGRGTITLKLKGARFIDWDSFHGLVNVMFDFSGMDVDLDKFKKLVGLTMLVLEDTNVSDEEIYELFRDHANRTNMAVFNGKLQLITWSSIPTEYKQRTAQAGRPQGVSVAPLSFGEQVEKCYGILQELGKTSGLQFLKDMRGRKSLVFSLQGTNFNDLDDLLDLTDLQILDLREVRIADETIFKFFVKHVNRKNLEILNQQGQRIRRQDLPANYRIQAGAPLSLEEERAKAEKIFELDDDVELILESDGRLVGLILNGTEFEDLRALNDLVNLRTLDLQGTGIPDAEIISFLREDYVNRRDLVVINNDGQEITWDDVYKEEAEEVKVSAERVEANTVLSLEEQVERAKEILLELGVRSKDLDQRIQLEGDDGFSLNLENLSLENLPALSQLTNLKVLYMSHASIKDLSPLTGLKNLSVLNLDQTSVTDLSPLRGLNNLRTLSLRGAASVVDLSPLAQLKNLNILMAVATSVTDLSPLAELTNLTHLLLGKSPVGDLSPLAELINLEHLGLPDTTVTKEQIYKLFMANDNRENLSALHNSEGTIEEITWADVPEEYKRKVVEVATAQQDGLNFAQQVAAAQEILKKLGVEEEDWRLTPEEDDFTLMLFQTEFQDIASLNSLTSLTHLSLSETKINNVSLLRYLVGRLIHLKILDLEKINIDLNEIFELFVESKNRENLNIIMDHHVITWADVPEEYKKRVAEAEADRDTPSDARLTMESVPALSFEQQLEKCRAILKKVGKTKGLSTRTDMEDRKNLFLSLEGTNFSDLDDLLDLTDLGGLDLTRVNISDQAIFEFFVKHINRKNLAIINQHGRIIRRHNLPKNYRIQAGAPFSLEEERAKAEKIFELDDDVELILEKDGRLVGLILNGTEFEDLHVLNDLVNLDILDLQGTGIPDAEIISFLREDYVNRRDLVVINNDGRKITLDKILQEFPELAEKISAGAKEAGVKMLSPQEERAAVIGLLSSLGIPEDQMGNHYSSDGLKLYLGGTSVRDLGALAGLGSLQELNLTNTSVSDLGPLAGLANLGSVTLSPDFNLDEIYNLFVRNDNRENLVVFRGVEKIIWADVPEEYKKRVAEAEGGQSESEPLSFEKQVERAKAMLERQGLAEATWRLELDYDRQRITLHLRAPLEDEDIDTLKELKNLKNLRLNFISKEPFDLNALRGLNLESLVIRHAGAITNISALKHFARLGLLNLKDTVVDDLQIYELFVFHPNRENLAVMNKEGREIAWNNVPEEYKKRVAEAEGGQSESEPLSFEEQVKRAKEIVKEGVLRKNPGIKIYVEEDWRIAFSAEPRVLNLRDLDFSDVSRLKDLTLINALNLSGTGVKTIDDLANLFNLYGLYLVNTSITHEQIYKLFLSHSNRKILQVVDADNHHIAWFDVPEEYKKRVAEAEGGQFEAPEEYTQKVKQAEATAFNAAAPEEKPLPASQITFLSNIVNSLINPSEVLEELARRFKQDDLQDDFDRILRALKIERKLTMVPSGVPTEVTDSLNNKNIFPRDFSKGGPRESPEKDMEDASLTAGYGGVAFQRKNLNLMIQNHGAPGDFNLLPEQNFLKLPIEGLLPVNLRITPIHNFYTFLSKWNEVVSPAQVSRLP